MNDINSTLARIKSRGYLSINVYPATDIIENIFDSVSKVKEMVHSSVVELRGWDYPHFPTHTDDKQSIYVGQNESIEAWIDWQNHKEVWRCYNNGQFVHLLGLREDWWEDYPWLNPNDPLKNTQPGKTLEVINTTYTLTEIYLFINNLLKNITIDEIGIKIKLIGTQGRKLTVFDPLRAPLLGDYVCQINEVVITDKIYKKTDLSSNYLQISLEQIIRLYQTFNWESPNRPAIEADQKKLLDRTL